MNNLLPLPVLLPMFGAALTLILGRRPRLQRVVSIGVLAGVSGVLSCLMPSSESASITPLVMHGGPPIAPDSPQPLAPSGLVLQGAESSKVTSIGGMSSARGTQ